MALVRPPKPELYVALGDSTAVGIGAEDSAGGYPARIFQLLRENRPALRFKNFGQSGATAQDVLRSQVARAVDEHPLLVTLCIGINDVARGRPDEAYAHTLEEIAVRLRPSGARVVLINLPDMAWAPIVAGLPRALYERRIELFNEHVEATAARHGFAYVDLFSHSRAVLPGHPEYFCADGFHPSAEGYEEWATFLAPRIEQALEPLRASGT